MSKATKWSTKMRTDNWPLALLGDSSLLTLTKPFHLRNESESLEQVEEIMGDGRMN